MVLTVIRWIGIILLIAAAVLLMLLLLLLFVPARMRAEGHLKAAEEEEMTLCGHLAVSWLLGVLRLEGCWDREERCFRFLVMGRPLRRRRRSGSQEEEKAPEEDEKAGLTFRQRCDKIIRTAEILARKENRNTLKKELSLAGKALGRALPHDWKISGPAGFETPDLTGALMALNGMLYPFIGGHVFIEPHFEGKYLDLCGDLCGPLRLYPVALEIARYYLNPELKRLRGQLKEESGDPEETGNQQNNRQERPGEEEKKERL